MSDESIWKTIGGTKTFCSHKMHTTTDLLCKNPLNVTGLCTQQSCPLSNSKYATVRESNGILHLYIKEPERSNKPFITYEKIELSNYNEALLIIDKELMYFDNFYKHKCKQRLTKLTQYLRRVEKGEKRIYTVLHRKHYKKEKVMCQKVKNKVNVEREVEKELVKRMEAGIYGEYVKEVLDGRGKLKGKEKGEGEGEERKGKKRNKKEGKKQFVSYFEESDECMDAGEMKKMKVQW